MENAGSVFTTENDGEPVTIIGAGGFDHFAAGLKTEDGTPLVHIMWKFKGFNFVITVPADTARAMGQRILDAANEAGSVVIPEDHET